MSHRKDKCRIQSAHWLRAWSSQTTSAYWSKKWTLLVCLDFVCFEQQELEADFMQGLTLAIGWGGVNVVVWWWWVLLVVSVVLQIEFVIQESQESLELISAMELLLFPQRFPLKLSISFSINSN